MILSGHTIGNIGGGGGGEVKVTSKTETTAVLSWKGNATSLEQSSDGGTTWTAATHGGLTATGTTVTGLSANTPYTFRVVFPSITEATTNTLDAQGEVWVINGTAITQNVALKKLDATDVTATIEYTDLNGENNLVTSFGGFISVATEQANTGQTNAHYKKSVATQDAILSKITFDKDVTLKSYFLQPRTTFGGGPARANGLGFVFLDSTGAEITRTNAILTYQAWTDINIANVRAVKFVIDKDRDSADGYSQFNYINLRVR